MRRRGRSEVNRNARLSVTFSGLPAGTYTFAVHASSKRFAGDSAGARRGRDGAGALKPVDPPPARTLREIEGHSGGRQAGYVRRQTLSVSGNGLWF